jgi:hypothetical protein
MAWRYIFDFLSRTAGRKSGFHFSWPMLLSEMMHEAVLAADGMALHI